ncbi:hypothetical protein [Streptomyces sp. 061-3]|uniref:hypothetical protein n=1 Tax=Streptomyces sp. 061-3 TaxID=2789268 RepID=UPI00397F89BF
MARRELGEGDRELRGEIRPPRAPAEPGLSVEDGPGRAVCGAGARAHLAAGLSCRA